MTTPDTYPEYVLEALAAVRETGATNMMYRRNVVEIADQLGFNEAATWLGGLPHCDGATYVGALRAMAEREKRYSPHSGGG